MSKLDQLRLDVRRLKASNVDLTRRLDAPETAQVREPRRIMAPRPGDTVVAARIRLWDRFVLLRLGHGPTRKLAFAMKHYLGDASEFRRFFSANDKRGVPEGSGRAARFYRALKDAIAESEARSEAGNLPMKPTQGFSVETQITPTFPSRDRSSIASWSPSASFKKSSASVLKNFAPRPLRFARKIPI